MKLCLICLLSSVKQEKITFVTKMQLEPFFSHHLHCNNHVEKSFLLSFASVLSAVSLIFTEIFVIFRDESVKVSCAIAIC